MKKFLNKISKVFVTMGVCISLFAKRGFALSPDKIELLYGPYEPPEPTIWEKCLRCLKILALPAIIIVLIIGIIAYFKKK